MHMCVNVFVYMCVGEGGGCLWVCFASVPGPVCVFAFVFGMTARRCFLSLGTKIKS